MTKQYKYPYQFNIDMLSKLKELNFDERYNLCCELVGKEKTDEYLRTPYLKRLWWKIKYKVV